MIMLGRHGSLQQTLSQALNTTGLYNDYTFRSMLQAQEIRLCSPDLVSFPDPPRNVERGSGILSNISWRMGHGRSRILKLESDGRTRMT